MSSVKTANLTAVDPEGIELVPATPGNLARSASRTISLAELRDFALTRYRQELSAVRDATGEINSVQSRLRETKDQAKVNQYSSHAFTKVAKEWGWDASARAAIEAALVKADELAKTDRKPRAELNRALVHLSKLEQQKAGVAELPTRCATKSSERKERKPFARMLHAAIERNGVSITTLAAKFGITYLKLWKWQKGDDEPSDDTEKTVKKMAIYLGLSGKELWALRATLPKRICWPIDFPPCRKVRDRVIRKCPGLATLSPEEQAIEIWKAHNEPPAAPKRNKKHRLSRDMSKWPPQLAAGVGALLDIKRNRSEPVLQH